MIKVRIIDYNCGNTFSIQNIFKNLGCEVLLSKNNLEIMEGDLVILPGVGSFPYAMKNLKKNGFNKNFFDELLFLNKKIIGICLGFQLLFTSSEEFEYTDGLNLIQGRVTKLENSEDKNIKVPNIGWRKVTTDQLHEENYFSNLNNKLFYFIHSYGVYSIFDEKNIDTLQTLEFKKNIICSIKKNNLYGFQFHPEKSGVAGYNLLNSILNVYV